MTWMKKFVDRAIHTSNFLFYFYFFLLLKGRHNTQRKWSNVNTSTRSDIFSKFKAGTLKTPLTLYGGISVRVPEPWRWPVRRLATSQTKMYGICCLFRAMKREREREREREEREIKTERERGSRKRKRERDREKTEKERKRERRKGKRGWEQKTKERENMGGGGGGTMENKLFKEERSE